MVNIFIDIETIPAGEPIDPESLSHPANITKPETIATWYCDKAPALAEEEYRKRALDSMKGEILCIGFAVEDEQSQSLTRDGIDEEQLMLLFDQRIAEVATTRNKPVWIGHNAKEFDMLWLWRRTIKYGLHGLRNMIQLDRYKGNVEDTMVLWQATDWKGRTSLSTLGRYLGVGSKTPGMDGLQVYDYYLQGRLGEIAAYCRDDVRLVRNIYRKLNGLEPLEVGHGA